MLEASKFSEWRASSQAKRPAFRWMHTQMHHNRAMTVCHCYGNHSPRSCIEEEKQWDHHTWLKKDLVYLSRDPCGDIFTSLFNVHNLIITSNRMIYTITAKFFTNNMWIPSFPHAHAHTHTEPAVILMKDPWLFYTLLFYTPSRCTNAFKLQKTWLQRTTTYHVLVETPVIHTHRQLMLYLFEESIKFNKPCEGSWLDLYLHITMIMCNLLSASPDRWIQTC